MEFVIPPDWGDEGDGAGLTFAYSGDDASKGLHVSLAAISGRAFNSVRELKAYVASSVVPMRGYTVVNNLVRLPAGGGVVTHGQNSNRFYDDYWILHDGTAYVFRSQGTLAYQNAHRTSVARLARTVTFDDDDLEKAYDVTYSPHWTAKIGGRSGHPQLTIELNALDFSTALRSWTALITVRAPGDQVARIVSVGLARTDKPSNVNPSSTETSTSYLSFSGKDVKKPFALTLPPGREWDGFVTGKDHAQFGGYGSLSVSYTVDGRSGRYTFPALPRPGRP